jgi:peptide/nickel transport system substrate-binding protein
MRDKTIRTTGATIVLLFVVAAAVSQFQPAGDQPAAIQPDPLTPLASPAGSGGATESVPEPFVYRVGVLSGVTTTNFWSFYGESVSVWDSYILGPTKPALYTLDPATGAIRPQLALSEARPRFDESGWRVRVTLTDQLEWSDGEPITADDMVFTFETVRRLGLGGTWSAAYPGIIESVHADSPTELRIEFSQRPNLGVWPNAVGLAPLMPAHVWQPLMGDFDMAALYAFGGEGDVGGGPLVLESVSADLVVSLANPGYTIGSSPDMVEYRVYPDEEAAVAALDAGLIDTMISPKGLTEAQTAAIRGDDQIEVMESPANGIRYLGFNLTREPMSDQAFRTSLALLIDREQIAGELAAEGSVAHSFIPEENTRWFDPEAAAVNAGRYRGDLATRLSKALEMLRTAGYAWATEPAVTGDTVTPGTGLTIRGREPAILTILTPGDAYDPSRPLHAAAIAETLGWLGFEVRPVETDFDSVVDLAFTPGDDGALHYDMYLLGWALGSPVVPGYYRALFAPDGHQNNTGYRSDRFNAALERFEGSFSLDDARDALWSMESILSEDLPYLLLYSPSMTEAFRADRVRFGLDHPLGGLQGRLGGIGDVAPVTTGAGGTLAG